MANENRTVRWGILGTARIARKLAAAIHATANAELIAVASRSQQRADEWAAEHGAQESYEGYQSLLDNADVDAIYVPLPPSMHHEWTIRSAQSERHVLCEKPLAIDAVQGEEMVAACREHNVQLMDSTMWVHHPRAADMKRHVNDSLGTLRRLTSGFTIPLNDYLLRNPSYLSGAEGSPTAQQNERPSVTLEDARAHELRLSRELGGGALGDLGWYCVRAALWTFDAVPTRVFASARYENDVDMNLSAMLWFDDDRVASFDCGYDSALRKWFEVTGTDGSLVCDDFVGPNDPRKMRFWVHDMTGGSNEVRSESGIQEQFMVENFCDIVRSGTVDEFWSRISLDNQRVCDAIDKSARTCKVVEIV